MFAISFTTEKVNKIRLSKYVSKCLLFTLNAIKLFKNNNAINREKKYHNPAVQNAVE